jgi:hypothetical protein
MAAVSHTTVRAVGARAGPSLIIRPAAYLNRRSSVATVARVRQRSSTRAASLPPAEIRTTGSHVWNEASQLGDGQPSKLRLAAQL